MKRMLLVSGFFLTACAGGGGAGAPIAVESPLATGCEAPQDVFLAGSKVQLAGDDRGGHVTTGSSSENLLKPALMLNGLTRVQIEVSGEKIIQAGTRLTAVIKNSCDNPGNISLRIERNNSATGLPGVRSYPFDVPMNISRSALERLAESDPCVEGLSDTTIEYVSALSQDPLVRDQGHFAMLAASDAYPIFYDSALGRRQPVVIAVVDTGIDVHHVDLKDVLWKNTKEIPDNKIDDDQNGYVDDVNGWNFASDEPSPMVQGDWSGNYHGTHVAGLAAARGNNGVGVSGVMGTGAQIMALNVFGEEPGALSYRTENAIRYAADNGADIINLSLSGASMSASYQSALTYAVAKGATVVAAAGNEAVQLSADYFVTPGSYGKSIAGMVTVGSVDSSNWSWSRFSNYSPSYVELAAPGSEDSVNGRGVLSTMPGNTYNRTQGTSMAVPIAAGSAGLTIQLLRARGYNATPARIEAALENSGQVLSVLRDKVRDGRVLNLRNLANYITTNYPTRSTPEPKIEEGTVPVDPGTDVTVPCP